MDNTRQRTDELQTQIVTDSGNTYICEAVLWTSLSENKWRIVKIDSNWNKTYPISKITWWPTVLHEFNVDNVLSYVYSNVFVKDIPTVSFTINNWDLTTTSRDVSVQLNVNSYTDISEYFISETNNFNLGSCVLHKPETFTLSEWYWVKTLYVYVVNKSNWLSPVAIATIDFVDNSIPTWTAPTITPARHIHNINNSTVPSVSQMYYDIADVDWWDLIVTISVDDWLISLDWNPWSTSKSLTITWYDSWTHSFFYHNDWVTDTNFDWQDLVTLTVQDSTWLTWTNTIIIQYN